MKTRNQSVKLIIALLVVTLLLTVTSCDAIGNLFGGSLEMTSFVVNRASVKTEYVIGEKIDFKGISAEAKYNDATLNKTYVYDELTIEYPDDITATVGIKEVTVSFIDPNLNIRQEAKVQIIVSEDPNAVKHQSYIIKQDNMRLEYFVGEAVNFEGVMLYEKMTDGSEVLINDTEGLSFNCDNATITATPGLKTITVTYNGENAGAITISVSNPKITSTVLNLENVNVDYNVGDTVSFDGISALVTYENGETRTISSFTYITDLSALTQSYGTKTVYLSFKDTVSGEDVTASFVVKVDGVTGYEFNSDNIAKNYYVGEAVDMSNISVVAKYAFSDDKALTLNEITHNADGITATAGSKTILVKVGNETVGYFEISVTAISASVTVNTANVDLSYKVGEAVSLDGLVFTVSYNDPSKQDHTVDLSELTYDISSLNTGKNIVVVSYNDAYAGVVSTTVEITIHGIERYVADTSAMKTQYDLGETVTADGLKVEAVYTDGDRVECSGITLGSVDTSKAGDKTVAVLLNGVEICTLTVTVVNPQIKSITVNTNGVSLLFNVGDAVTKDSFAGITITITYENDDGETGTATVDVFEIKTELSSITATAGEKNITIEFNNYIGSVSTVIVTIKVDGITGYEFSQGNAKTEYFIGDSIDLDGISVTAIYAFSAKQEVNLGKLTHNGTTATAGVQTITVKLGEITVGQFGIVVKAITASAEIDVSNVDTSYRVYETGSASLAGLVFKVNYNNPAIADKTIALSELTYDISSLKTGTNLVTVSYTDSVTGETLSANVSITVYGIAEYIVDASDVKNTYYIGETASIDGLKVWAHYNDGGEDVAIDAASVTIGTVDSSTAGVKTVNVYVDGNSIGKTITFVFEKNSVVKAEVIGNYTSIYEKNTALTKDNFDGLSVKLTYKSGEEKTITLDGLTFPEISTSSIGTQAIVITYTDEKNGNEEGSVSFNIEIVEPKIRIDSFTKPENIAAFEESNSHAGETSYGEVGFMGQFVYKKTLYTVGSYNPFKFLPILETADENGGTVTRNGYYSEVTIYIYDNGSYTELTASKDPSSQTVLFYHGDVLMATVDTYNGSYQFAKAAEGKQLKISVLPSSDVFIIDEMTTAAVLEIEVIDAYNVYTAAEMSVIDNAPAYSRHESWDDFKLANGIPIADDINGIVLHDNIHIHYTDIPEAYLYVKEGGVTYINSETGEAYNRTEDTRYVRDDVRIYNHIGEGEFVIEGNLFMIDTIKFPLVSSPAIFGADSGKHYEEDFSNTSLFYFGDDGSYVSEQTIKISNVNLVGNAQRNNYVDTEGYLASSGGLIFTKASTYVDMTVDNTIGNSYFIAYYAEQGGSITLNDVKCYNSYQNAAMTWGNITKDGVLLEETLIINRSFISGAGGPLIIAQSTKDSSDVWHKPIIIIDDATKLETHLSGSEIWFTAVNATATVSQMKALSTSLSNAGLGTFVNPESGSNQNTMNIIGLLMANGNDAAQIVMGVDAEGTMLVGNAGLVRLKSEDYWNGIYNSNLGGTYIFQSGAPILTVYDASGNAYTAIAMPDSTGSSFTVVDLTGTPVQYNAELTAAFQNAKMITLTQGGLTVIFEFYH